MGSMKFGHVYVCVGIIFAILYWFIGYFPLPEWPIKLYPLNMCV